MKVTTYPLTSFNKEREDGKEEGGLSELKCNNYSLTKFILKVTKRVQTLFS